MGRPAPLRRRRVLSPAASNILIRPQPGVWLASSATPQKWGTLAAFTKAVEGGSRKRRCRNVVGPSGAAGAGELCRRSLGKAEHLKRPSAALPICQGRQLSAGTSSRTAIQHLPGSLRSHTACGRCSNRLPNRVCPNRIKPYAEPEGQTERGLRSLCPFCGSSSSQGLEEVIDLADVDFPGMGWRTLAAPVGRTCARKGLRAG